MSIQDENPDDLIASFYDAAVGRQAWPEVLDRLARRLDCSVVQIIGVDQAAGRLTYSYEAGKVPAGAVVDYAMRYHRNDPHVERMAGRPIGEVVSFSRVFDEAAVACSPFYQEFLLPYGVRHMHAAKLFDDGKRAVLIGMMRAADQVPMDGNHWSLAQRLCFHLARAAALHEDHRRNDAQAAIGREVLDRFSTPVWVLDERRRVLQCNRAAQAPDVGKRFLAADLEGRLRALDSAAETDLDATLPDLVQGVDGKLTSGDRAVVPLPNPGGGPSAIGRLLAIRTERTMSAFGAPAMALLMLHDPQADIALDPFLLTAAFDMTPAEARVAAALAKGTTPKRIAEAFGVSLNTVQTQIRRACEKVNVRRTIDLVATLQATMAGARH
jgi:DNA-binding CsgD family transcriptional regulator/PAS domain-containing protein